MPLLQLVMASTYLPLRGRLIMASIMYNMRKKELARREVGSTLSHSRQHRNFPDPRLRGAR